MASKRGKLRVVRGEDAYPFVLGEVVEGLQAAGVTTDDAIRLARDAEKEFSGGKNRVPMAELVRHLARGVERNLGGDAMQRFLGQTPPFVPLLVDRKGRTEPFDERALVKALKPLDLEFKEAFSLARQLGQGLRAEGYETVAQPELNQRMALMLEARYGREMRLRFEASSSRPSELMIVTEDSGQLPFSRGVLAQSMMASGLEPDMAYNLAKRVEDQLWRLGRLELPSSQVRHVAGQMIQEVAGDPFAQRYELMGYIHQHDQPLVILIGGAAGVGKSAVASELAYRLGIPRVVSTDSVRQALRSLISPELSPVLHSSSYSAWKSELMPAEQEEAKPKPKRVIRGFQSQVQQLQPALSAIVERSIHEATSLVLEGTHLLPGISPQGSFAGATVVELVLVVKDEESHAVHFGVREGTTRAKRSRDDYLSHFSEIRLLQNFVAARAEEMGVPVVEAGDFDVVVDRAIDHVLDGLLTEGAVAAGHSVAGNQ